MTWGEFKAEVDRQLAEQGKDDTVEVWYIDVSFPDAPERLSVETDDPCGLSVHY